MIDAFLKYSSKQGIAIFKIWKDLIDEIKIASVINIGIFCDDIILNRQIYSIIIRRIDIHGDIQGVVEIN